MRAVRTRSPRARLCPICQTPMKKPGRTAAGTQRWKCTAPVGPPTPRLDRPRPDGPPTPRWTAVTGGYGGPTGEQRSNRQAQQPHTATQPRIATQALTQQDLVNPGAPEPHTRSRRQPRRRPLETQRLGRPNQLEHPDTPV
ncbi:transposase-like zinc-binding domain-containing protein [Actinomyces sp. Z16]|uniref:transposase-like zinc-binding domain-containing protein n=1 Tax=Actinomyces sp. Z16 TaxID=2079536 RepID=UPI003FA39A70